jgi:hypothetical protein
MQQPDYAGLPSIARAKSMEDMSRHEWNRLLSDPLQDWAHFQEEEMTSLLKWRRNASH